MVQQRGRRWSGRFINLGALPNGLEVTRFGLVVGSRVGSAVVRNRIKRRLRVVVRQLPTRQGWDLVLAARRSAAAADFGELKASVESLLLRAGLLVAPKVQGVRP